MTTITRGVLFVTRRPAIATFEGSVFTLTLHLIDRQGPQRTEPYVVRWSGEDARAWWVTHKDRVQPGTPLQVELHNPRSFLGRLGAPETHAAVQSCALAPLAPSHAASAQRANEQQPPRAMPA